MEQIVRPPAMIKMAMERLTIPTATTTMTVATLIAALPAIPATKVVAVEMVRGTVRVKGMAMAATARAVDPKIIPGIHPTTPVIPQDDRKIRR